jgi:hypothetical protein
LVSLQKSFFVLIFLFIGCDKPSNNLAVLAKVENAELLEKDLSSDPANSKIKRDRLVNQWVSDEILFNSAVKSGFNNDTDLNFSSKKYARKLLGQRYLKTVVGRDLAVSSDEVVEYYKNNLDSFKRTKKEAKVYHLFTDNKKEALEIVRVLGVKGKKQEKNELFVKRGIHPVVVRSGSVLPELEKTLFLKTSKKRLWGPIKSRFGYHILFVLERYEPGSVIVLEEVYDEVFQRVFQQKFALKSLHVLDSLRNHTPYIIN